MPSLARFANPIEAAQVEASLGRRGAIQTTAHSPEQGEHIAKLLRSGLTHGIGAVVWSLRTPPKTRYSQFVLNQIADEIEEGFGQGSVENDAADSNGQAPWALEIRA